MDRSMGRKRKTEASVLDEVDRTMYSTFRGAANSLSQLYTQAMNHQKLSFHAGERHALEKLYQWILRQHEEGSRVTVTEIVSHIENEIDYGRDDVSVQLASAWTQTSASATAHRADQAKNSVFSNALSSPIRRSLQHYQLVHGGAGSYPKGRHGHRTHDSNSANSNDSSSMDMHADSPTNEYY